MHKIIIFPLGNADCTRIDLENGKKLLFDYAATRDCNDQFDLRCDLPTELREDLNEVGRNYYDVVSISHLDEDHYKGASDFFWLEHAEKYQGKDRIKINVLWVPAAIITEEGTENAEGKIIQAEARHRFKEGKRIRVFSRPEKLRQWCEDRDIDFDDRKKLITDAGQIAPGFSLAADGVEFFVHSPFAKRLNSEKIEDRNDDSIAMQAVFEVDKVQTKALLMADVTYEIISDIVGITRDTKERPERLEWDIVKLPHHCSYHSIGPEKGDDKTAPEKNVEWLYEEQGQDGGMIISTSKPIPEKGSDEDKDKQPPHRQAANYYKGIVEKPKDQFLVTMEHPSKTKPKPIVIEIDSSKSTLKKSALTAAVVASKTPAPRAG